MINNRATVPASYWEINLKIPLYDIVQILLVATNVIWKCLLVMLHTYIMYSSVLRKSYNKYPKDCFATITFLNKC